MRQILYKQTKSSQTHRLVFSHQNQWSKACIIYSFTLLYRYSQYSRLILSSGMSKSQPHLGECHNDSD